METLRGTAVVLTVCALTLVFCMWAAFEIGKRGAELAGALDDSAAHSRPRSGVTNRDAARARAETLARERSRRSSAARARALATPVPVEPSDDTTRSPSTKTRRGSGKVDTPVTRRRGASHRHDADRPRVERRRRWRGLPRVRWRRWLDRESAETLRRLSAPETVDWLQRTGDRLRDDDFFHDR